MFRPAVAGRRFAHPLINFHEFWSGARASLVGVAMLEVLSSCT